MRRQPGHLLGKKVNEALCQEEGSAILRMKGASGLTHHGHGGNLLGVS